jgi:uncharacterized protein YdbL (DUF1318 family)
MANSAEERTTGTTGEDIEAFMTGLGDRAHLPQCGQEEALREQSGNGLAQSMGESAADIAQGAGALDVRIANGATNTAVRGVLDRECTVVVTR